MLLMRFLHRETLLSYSVPFTSDVAQVVEASFSDWLTYFSFVTILDRQRMQWMWMKLLQDLLIPFLPKGLFIVTSVVVFFTWIYHFVAFNSEGLKYLHFLSCRMEAFNTIFGQHIKATRLESTSIQDIEVAVNSASDAPYSRAEIVLLLEVRLIFSKVTSLVQL